MIIERINYTFINRTVNIFRKYIFAYIEIFDILYLKECQTHAKRS
jgi:hypothetical protein